jgi:CRP-like cAMP-binding protein
MSWLLDAVPPDEQERVESALATCSALSLPAGSSLGADRLGTVPLLSVEDGLVLVSAHEPGSARRIVVGVAGPGSILVAPADRERLEALSDARLTLIPTSAQRRLLAIATAATVIVEALAGGVRECRESLAQFASRRHSDRVRQKLDQLARAHGKVGREGLLLDLPLTHDLLADLVGSRRETVTRSLAQLARDGLISHERGRYLITVPPPRSLG